MIPHYGAVKIATSFLIIQVTWVELGSWWVELVGRCGWPLGGVKGLYTPSEKRACNSHSDCRNIEIFQRY